MMFNGHHNAVTKTHRMEANMGETVRIEFGVGGPNFTSRAQVIGQISDRVHNLDEAAPPHR
jgi:nitrite reductase (NO-forming)